MLLEIFNPYASSKVKTSVLRGAGREELLHLFVKSNNFIYIADTNSHILRNLSLCRPLMIQIKRSFPIHLWESFSKFTFTFDQEEYKNYVNKILTIFFDRSRELTSIMQRRESHFQSQSQAVLVVFRKIINSQK